MPYADLIRADAIAAIGLVLVLAALEWRDVAVGAVAAVMLVAAWWERKNLPGCDGSSNEEARDMP